MLDLGPVLDTHDFGAMYAEPLMPIHLGGEYYAVIYRQASASAWIKTFRITPLGMISDIDEWEFTTEGASVCRIHHISSDLYAITYHWHFNLYPDGRLRTLHISSTGSITKSFDGSHHMVEAQYPGFLIQISGSVYALVMGMTANNHRVTTFTISSPGGGISLIDEYKYYSTGYYNEAAGLIDSNIIFSCFAGDNNYYLFSFYIDNAGQIEEPYRDRFDGPFNLDHWPIAFAPITSNIYAFAMRDATPKRISIETFYCNNAGTFNLSIEDSLIIDDQTSHYGGLTYSGTPDKYFLTSPLLNEHGIAYVILIDQSGAISLDPLYSSFEFDTDFCKYPVPLPYNEIYFPVFYMGDAAHGFIATITFSAPSALTHHELTMGIGP